MPISKDIIANIEESASMDKSPKDTQTGSLFEIDEKHLVRKIDYRIMPLMFLCYLMQFLDKVLINYSNVMGLSVDVNLKGNEFSWMATAFFVAYALAEIPQGANVVCWGITVTCTAACNSFGSLLAVRIILGALEAVISPALVLITSTWYQRKEATPRVGIWYCGLGGGQITGSLLSFAFQHVATKGFEGWRMMFVVVGAINVIIGAAVLIWLPASPQVAPFLTADEKSLALVRLATNQSGIGNRPAKKRQIIDAFTDAQVWLLCLITVLSSLPSGVITTFSATLIRNFGYNSKQAALLNVPGGFVSILSTMIGTVAIGRGYARWASILCLAVPTIIGGALMSFLPTTQQGGLLAGIYLINCIVANVAIVYSWTGANIAGYTKKVTANGMVAASFAIANILGPQTFQANDAPQYIPAKITLLVVAACAAVACCGLRILLGARNKTRRECLNEALQHADEILSSDYTDTENKSFRYTY
ncbi:hypothetical protein IFR04_015185 [Cadophora malorum]|uniref:Major facilitator superfamily (MFS) profile domain-containing protein n=1 Tax=Cadophora malorum TaxID=108018 RepID=A0A8H7W1I0_9HELO|nr:hypothetical protein IFR04_015185 [Cadophora malorum]